MSQTKFEEFLRKHEEDLKRIRSEYFPLIEEGIITGYNLYPNLFDYSKGRLFLNYLHSDLRPKDKHFQELSEILRTAGFLEERIVINDGLIDRRDVMEREADYITRPGWEEPSNMRYFDFDGEELSQEEAKALRRNMIGESLQYDLLLRVKNELELRRLVNLFKRYVSKHVLDRDGREVIKDGYPIENEDAVFNAWEIPLLTCTSTNNKKPGNLNDFLVVNQFNITEQIGNTRIILSTLVGAQSGELHRVLKYKGDKFQFDKKYALRVFVEDYIEA